MSWIVAILTLISREFVFNLARSFAENIALRLIKIRTLYKVRRKKK